MQIPYKHICKITLPVLVSGRNSVIYIILPVFSFRIKTFDRFRASVSGNNKLFKLAYLWILFSFIIVMFRTFFIGTINTKILTINSIVMVLINIVLNYILIFGKFGFPALGM